MNVDKDDEVLAEVKRMEMAERERMMREEMAEECTVLIGDAPVTATEFEWHQLLAQVSRHYGWATQVMTWLDLERMISETVGWSDQAYEEFPDAATRKAMFFDDGIRNLDCWQDAGHVWTTVQMVGHVLSRMGYFDGPQDMIAWITQAMEADGESEVIGGVFYERHDDDD